jgi:hypothetical protein
MGTALVLAAPADFGGNWLPGSFAFLAARVQMRLCNPHLLEPP